MPRYLYQASYSDEGVRGLLEEGGTGRRAAAAAVVESLGGSLESIDYAFGANDVFVIVDLPDDEAAAAASMRIASTGALRGHMVKLLTPEQIDEAAARELSYRPPGADG